MSSASIDWPTAVRIGVRSAPTGPSLAPLEAALAVADLRQFSRDAELVVREVTGLGAGLPVLDGVVVDRPGWIAATAEGMEILTAPMTNRLTEELDSRTDRRSTGHHGAHRTAGRKSATRTPVAPSTVAAAPIGTVLGYLSGKVLGQFDPFVADPGTPDQPGRLLLVAPNIVKVERELEVTPRDFRMWVCLHESTHRLQFSAVPWMSGHFQLLVNRFAEEADLDPGAVADRISAAWKSVVRGAASRGSGSPDDAHTSWIEATQTPGQRAVFDQLLAMMTLLEGHADYVMDAAGPRVIPSVAAIRARFTTRRRKGNGPIDRLIRALLGMDLKLRQYVQGGAFVHAVVDQVGMANFNAIWDSPETLPTQAEILEPASWVARVRP